MESTFVPGLWTSLSVNMTSGTKNLEGRLSVMSEDESLRTVTSYRDVRIAASSKLLHRFAFRPYASDITVSFVPSDKKLDPILHHIRLKPFEKSESRSRTTSKIVAVCGGSLRKLRIAGASVNAHVVSMSPADLPDQWYALESVSTLVITPSAFSELAGVQEAALTQWVKAGGRLVVQTQQALAARHARGMASLLPADVIGASSVPEKKLCPERESGRILEIAQFGRVTGTEIEWQGLPVAVEAAAGLGTVVLAGIDLSDVLFTYENSRQTLERILRAREFGVAMPAFNHGEFRRREGAKYAQAIPACTVLGLLLVYLVLVGPVDYFLLKKAKRLQWTWFTFSAASIAATLALLCWVYRAKAGVLSTTTLSAVMLAPGGVERTVSLTDIYFQKTAAYSFTAEDNAVIRPIGLERSYGFAASLIKEMKYGIHADPGFAMESYRMPIWTYLTLRTDKISIGKDSDFRFGKDGDLVLNDSRLHAANRILLDLPPGLQPDRADEYAQNALSEGSLSRTALGSLEFDFLTTAISEYFRMKVSDTVNAGRLLVVRVVSKHPPFLVAGHDPTTRHTAYVISYRDAGDQAGGSANHESIRNRSE